MRPGPARRSPLSNKLSTPIVAVCIGLLPAGLSLWAAPASATWSIVAADSLTQEVAVGSATCVTNFDLRAVLPAIRVGRGAGAAQSAVDNTGVRRMTMVDGWTGDLDAATIMGQLAALGGSDFHQNGVAGTDGTSATFSGSNTFAFSGGVTGSVGTLHYAIQGNILTGQSVVQAAEQALINTVGDLPEKLMAAMEAARAQGGDGRCSCSPGNPTGCGAPPPSFTKAADIGFLLVARYGDTDDPSCTSNGCADGDYFLNLNVANQGAGDPDPVLQLASRFADWRDDQEGRPDAVATSLEITPTPTGYLLRFEPRDWRGDPLGTLIDAVDVVHAPGSSQGTTIGIVTHQGGGIFQVPLTRTANSGVDLFEITLDDGAGAVVLPPRTTEIDLAAVFADGFESSDLTRWSATTP